MSRLCEKGFSRKGRTIACIKFTVNILCVGTEHLFQRWTRRCSSCRRYNPVFFFRFCNYQQDKKRWKSDWPRVIFFLFLCDQNGAEQVCVWFASLVYASFFFKWYFFFCIMYRGWRLLRISVWLFYTRWPSSISITVKAYL